MWVIVVGGAPLMRHGAVRLLDAEPDITAAGGDTVADGLAALAMRVAEQPLPRKQRYPRDPRDQRDPRDPRDQRDPGDQRDPRKQSDPRGDDRGGDTTGRSNTRRPLVAVLEDATPQELTETASDLLRRGWDDARLVVQLREPTPEDVDALLAAGAHAVIAQESPGNTLCHAARAAAAGQTYVDRAELRLPLPDRRRPDSGPSSLTRQELRVIRYLPEGRSNLEIATELDVSVHTVRTHLRNAFVKLGAANRVAAGRIAVRERLVTSDEFDAAALGLDLATDQPGDIPVPTSG